MSFDQFTDIFSGFIPADILREFWDKNCIWIIHQDTSCRDFFVILIHKMSKQLYGNCFAEARVYNSVTKYFTDHKLIKSMKWSKTFMS